MKKLVLGSVLALALAAGVHAQTTLNVRDADIRAFIADAAKVTGRTFIIDNRVNGKVTVVTDRPLSKSEYFEIFLSTLRSNGLVAVPTSGGAFRVQPVDNAASQPSRIGAAGANRNAYVTEIIRLRAIDAPSALETVRPLVSAQGSVTANRAGNTLVVVDFADNIRRIREVVRRIDADNASTRVIALRNAGAREIATALQTLAGGGGGAGQGGAAPGGTGVSVVAIDSSNSIALRGDPSSVARFAQIAIDLDNKAKSGTEIRVVFLENADAEQLLPVLQQLVGQTPDPVQETTLSRGSFTQTNSQAGSAAGTSIAQRIQPVAQPQSSNAPGAGGQNGQPPAISTQGGRTAAVVTRFVGANAIVIAGPADIQRQIGEVIRQLDVRREQVLIEAIVAEVSDQTARRLGAQFLLGSLSGGAFAASTYGNTAPNILQIAGAVGAQTLGGNRTVVVAPDGTRTETNVPNQAYNQLTQSAVQSILGTTGGFAGWGGQIGDTVFGAIINAVKSDTTSNLLQVPHIITLDNQQAHSLVGQEIPVTTGQALSNNFDNAFRTVQRQNVGIQLDVKPQVNAGGSLKLYVRLEVSSIAGPVSSNNSELILNKRAFENVFTPDDGQITVIGGLLDDNERRTIEKIPLLGDIPGLGALFRSKARSRSKTNLMVFIRPTILRTPEDSRRVTEQRYGYLRQLQGYAQPGVEPSIDELVRDYMNAAPPIPHAPMPGNIEDPRIAVPVAKPVQPIKRRD
ncbi:type II secretion system secretin GspD [Sphingomonas sanguinis]|jgi:general secretion pathway protein D|uniref:Type II secretion system secretin GspD n=1 Tax=Sphingomonas sanguinis TaxID=33051 RepID=A0A7Y7URE9_9SPHN|nr:type II secretion system secretin GspD [Sphingomonas sanguinis]MBZ6381253.1 type II secretion system secretin GspD [Sphingomonas sanguinis]NNG50191.1 type II secretion system secretin GspD [Sphingomonas sanguinis]NNG55092.1 type II secretion system secretin GspD [Sphingomonas sanguinis]NVP30556.1 type II secretion system secretin GspD [Sphingomonas sanguinis]